MHRFTLVSREDCGLCQEMLAELEAFCRGRPCTIEIVDVDAQAALRLRYGHRVPVLLLEGEPICHGRFEADEVARLTR